MKPITHKTVIVLLLFLAGASSYAQSGFVAAGAVGTSGSGEASFSIGTLAYGQTAVSNGSLFSGMQYAFENITLSTPTTQLQTTIASYPNPTQDSLYLNIAESQLKGLSYTLYNIIGKQLVKDTPIYQSKSSIEMQDNPSGVYFLHINKGNIPVKTIKIIKR